MSIVQHDIYTTVMFFGFFYKFYFPKKKRHLTLQIIYTSVTTAMLYDPSDLKQQSKHLQHGHKVQTEHSDWMKTVNNACDQSKC